MCYFRENVKHFFECFCEVVPPSDNSEPWIIQQFPEKYKDEEVLKSVPKFAYPYKIEKYISLIPVISKFTNVIFLVL